MKPGWFPKRFLKRQKQSSDAENAKESIEDSRIVSIRLDLYERCDICGRLTDVPKSLDIKYRKTYVEGAGQLCRECCIRLYHTDDLRFLE